MPNIDDLFDKHGPEIAKESVRFKEAMQTEIPRDPLRRPWNDSSRAPAEKNLDEGRSPQRPPFIETPSNKSQAWYATSSSFLAAAKSHRQILSTFFFISSVLFIAAAQFLPITYSSSLQLFAPDKGDKISSRLQLFANRIEFASFPTDLKIPLGLIVRRLKSPIATAWVLEKYQALPASQKVLVLPKYVQAETFYAEGSELLTIQGYANDPVAARDITNLYWDYFEKEVALMRTDHLEKVSEWIQLTTLDLTRKLASLTQDSAKVAAAAPGAEQTHLQSKLSESYADILMRKIRIQKEHDELSQVAATKSLGALFKIDDPEIQDSRRIYEALQGQEATNPDPRVSVQKAQLEKQVRESVASKLAQQQAELESLAFQIQKLKPRLSSLQSSEAGGDAGTLKMHELARQQDQYQMQLDELENLKAQIKVESDITESRLKPIQAAVVDPTTGRPYRSVIVAVCLFAAAFLTLLALIFLQFQRKPESTF